MALEPLVTWFGDNIDEINVGWDFYVSAVGARMEYVAILDNFTTRKTLCWHDWPSRENIVNMVALQALMAGG